jgi:hypothetical protein
MHVARAGTSEVLQTCVDTISELLVIPGVSSRVRCRVRHFQSLGPRFREHCRRAKSLRDSPAARAPSDGCPAAVHPGWKKVPRATDESSSDLPVQGRGRVPPFGTYQEHREFGSCDYLIKHRVILRPPPPRGGDRTVRMDRGIANSAPKIGMISLEWHGTC